ncbi:hypothetical protein MML48_2g00000589 [Holotrichia oblita]|uniref:Uncharacterized protein n=1 Tax=Holotrichia oblita TaxID=644536 RepID=A0ACB9TIC9_HOLOL|nr:hypothetical protein MML48_2g00000589 [Holotrichia oblita]
MVTHSNASMPIPNRKTKINMPAGDENPPLNESSRPVSLPASDEDFEEENEQVQESEEVVETEQVKKDVPAKELPTKPQPGPSFYVHLQRDVMKEFMRQNELTPKEKIGWRKRIQFLTPNIKWFEKTVEDVVELESSMLFLLNTLATNCLTSTASMKWKPLLASILSWVIYIIQEFGVIGKWFPSRAVSM